MLTYFLRRLLLSIPTLLGITFLVFMLVALAPGGMNQATLEARTSGDAAARSAQARYLRERYGLDAPPFLQYTRWLHRISPVKFGAHDGGLTLIPNMLHINKPDLGRSYARSTPVSELIGAALPVTLLLNLLAFAITYAVGVPMGIFAAARRGSWFDSITGGFAIALWSMPIIWAGVALRGFLTGPNSLGWFPTGGLHDAGAASMPFLPGVDESGAYSRGLLLDSAWHLCLPVACLTFAGFAIVSRHTRASMIEQLSADYARTARAKGASPRRVLLAHSFRNSLLPLITLMTGAFPAMLSGSIVVERIFNIPGMGMLLLDAVLLRDRELLVAVVLIAGILTIAATLAADALYALADPRIRLDARVGR